MQREEESAQASPPSQEACDCPVSVVGAGNHTTRRGGSSAQGDVVSDPVFSVPADAVTPTYCLPFGTQKLAR